MTRKITIRKARLGIKLRIPLPIVFKGLRNNSSTDTATLLVHGKSPRIYSIKTAVIIMIVSILTVLKRILIILKILPDLISRNDFISTESIPDLIFTCNFLSNSLISQRVTKK